MTWYLDHDCEKPKPSWIRHLGFLDFPKTLENAEIKREVVKTNKGIFNSCELKT